MTLEKKCPSISMAYPTSAARYCSEKIFNTFQQSAMEIITLTHGKCSGTTCEIYRYGAIALITYNTEKVSRDRVKFFMLCWK